MVSDNSEKIVEDVISLIDKLNLSGLSILVSEIKKRYNIAELNYSSSNENEDSKKKDSSSSAPSTFSLVLSSLPTTSLASFYITVAKLWGDVIGTSQNILKVKNSCNEVVSKGGDVLVSKIPSDMVENFKNELKQFEEKGAVFQIKGENII